MVRIFTFLLSNIPVWRQKKAYSLGEIVSSFSSMHVGGEVLLFAHCSASSSMGSSLSSPSSSSSESISSAFFFFFFFFFSLFPSSESSESVSSESDISFSCRLASKTSNVILNISANSSKSISPLSSSSHISHMTSNS